MKNTTQINCGVPFRIRAEYSCMFYNASHRGIRIPAGRVYLITDLPICAREVAWPFASELAFQDRIKHSCLDFANHFPNLSHLKCQLTLKLLKQPALRLVQGARSKTI